MSAAMRKMRKKMEDEHHKRSAAHKTTQEDLANYHSKINATDDIGELLKEHRRNEDKLKNMEKTKKAEQEQRFKERQQAEKEAKEGIAALKWFAPKQKEKKESTKAMAEALRANLHAFYDMMQMTQHVRKELGKIFMEFDANNDGSIDIHEFRTHLNEPRERLPLLARLFMMMDDDVGHDDDEKQDHGVGELDMFEFFVGYYSICTLPRGDFTIRLIWDLYDPKKKGKIPYRTFKKMLRDSMGACLPDYVIRADDHLPPAIEEKMHELRKAQGAELWTRMHVGDVCVRTDAEGYKHMALVRGLTDISITVQDIYTLDNALGWTQGGDNCFTYELKTHPDIGERILPPAPGDDTFDDALERFLMLSADNDGDGEITLKEFRHFVRRRVSKGEPSPYAAFLTLQRKLRKVGNLGDEFWDQRGLELVIMMEKAGLWSAKELHRHVILKKVIRRPPVKYGGEVDVQPPEKKEKKAKGVKNVDKAPPMPISKKHRRTALKGEELIDACLKSRFATDDAATHSGPKADHLMREHSQNLMRDDAARKATLVVVVVKAEGLINTDLLGKSDPFVTVEGDYDEVGESEVKWNTLDPEWHYATPETRVPERLEVKLWDRDGDAGREPLGYCLIRRKRMWDVCRTAKRTVKLPVLGETASGRKATGDVTLELRWEPRPYDLDAATDGADAAAEAAIVATATAPAAAPPSKAPAPGRGRRSNMIVAGDLGIEGFDSDDSQYELLRKQTEIKAAPPPPVERRAADVRYVPLPAVTDAMLREPLGKCYCGFAAELTVDLLAHLQSCPEARKDPMRVVDTLLLLRTLDPGVAMKDASVRLLSASSASMIIQKGDANDRALRSELGGGRRGTTRARRNSGTGLALPAGLPGLGGLPGGLAGLGGDSRPGTAASAASAAASDRPGTAGDRPGTAGSRPGTAGSRPGTAGDRPGTAASDASSTASAPKRVSFFGMKKRRSVAAK